MSTATAMRKSNPWVTRARRMNNVDFTEVAGDGDILVEVDTVYFTHHGPRSHYRPALHIRGRLAGITPYDTDEFAYGVTQLTFDPRTEGGTPVVDAFYEFTDEQLAVLVGKGYFNEGFEPPSQLTEQVWTLPARYEALIIAPRTEQDAPLVFVDVVDRDGLLIDAERSGLDLSDYFPDYLSEIRQRQEGAEADTSVVERSAGVDDIFTEPVQSSYETDATDETEGRVNESEGASLASLTGPSGGSLPVVDSPLFNALITATIERNGEAPVALDLDPEDMSRISRSRLETQAATDAGLPTTSLDETFAAVMGDVIPTVIKENTPVVSVPDESDQEEADEKRTAEVVSTVAQRVGLDNIVDEISIEDVEDEGPSL